ncbi:trypsin-like serine protease [Nannocystis sp. ILAH1]|uniref:trypsin-like serine protease n=1 Tax=Nannocystis sp. ILAH1 TaxID=2996789 RepID=UPI00226F9A2E|nr:trypsin-like serine protease [Nannocystis sp. ILAH1]MCY0987157.1 trypsin-like serine protease [Nannocystis sp. ILAH1]
MRSPESILVLSPLFLVLAATVPIGCDAEDDSWSAELELRGNNGEPTPGSGTCEGCVAAAWLSSDTGGARTLQLCIDHHAMYTGSLAAPVDDTKIVELLQDEALAHWGLFKGEQDLCTTSSESSPCKVAEYVPPAQGERFGRMKIKFKSGCTPTHLRLDVGPWGSLTSPDAPALRLVTEPSDEPLSCPNALNSPKASKQGASTSVQPLLSGLAHITFPALLGGVHSCSGILVSDRHLLTAKHCVTPTSGNELSESGVNVRFAAPVVAPTLRRAGAFVVHPILDLAVATLDAPVDPLVNHPVSISTRSPGCTLFAQGFGVRGAPNEAYDWGVAKSISVIDALSPLSVGTYMFETLFGPGVLGADLLFFKGTTAEKQELCRGDSGGPVMQACVGEQSLIGITFARVYDLPSGGTDGDTGLQPLYGSLAFSRGNKCGETPLVHSVAVYLDQETRGWIHDTIAPPFIPVQPPADE